MHYARSEHQASLGSPGTLTTYDSSRANQRFPQKGSVEKSVKWGHSNMGNIYTLADENMEHVWSKSLQNLSNFHAWKIS